MIKYRQNFIKLQNKKLSVVSVQFVLFGFMKKSFVQNAGKVSIE